MVRGVCAVQGGCERPSPPMQRCDPWPWGYDVAAEGATYRQSARTAPMAIIPQTKLFGWEEVENLGELRRLELVLCTVPDEALMRHLEGRRGRGRDDYPVRAVWNAVLAGVVYQHVSVESLRRELLRNAQLRWLCGFDPVKPAEQAVPPSWVFSRSLKKLMACQEMIDGMFDELVEELRGELEGFGSDLACDSKAVRTHARARGKQKQRALEPDGRRDTDADVGVKTYRGQREDGTVWEKVRKWFGYKLHLVVDADYELPVAYEVTRASAPDNASASRMLDDLEARHGAMLGGCTALMADKAYDDTKLIKKLWDRDDPILPVIPKRQDWKDGEDTRPLCEGADNIVYDCQGQVYCHCWVSGKRRELVYWGYERERDSQKWRCPAAVYGVECESCERCNGHSTYGRVVRVARELDPRTFLPVARGSLKFSRLYKKRTSVERVNSRLDVSFGLEQHFIRGEAKMRARCSLALVVMLAMALGRVREKQRGKLRSLVAAPG